MGARAQYSSYVVLLILICGFASPTYQLQIQCLCRKGSGAWLGEHRIRTKLADEISIEFYSIKYVKHSHQHCVRDPPCRRVEVVWSRCSACAGVACELGSLDSKGSAEEGAAEEGRGCERWHSG